MSETGDTSLFRRIRVSLILLAVFWTIAIVLWQARDSIFFLFNFGYIGTAVAIGVGVYSLLPRKKKPTGRRLAQILVGGYMLGFLGVVKLENMQVEGFFFYLIQGFFAGAVIHYLVAKIAGPVIFGRGWCAWACWTAAILDLLPYKRNKAGRLAAGWEWLRYAHFALSLGLVLALWFVIGYRPEPMTRPELWWLLAGNALYFGAGIAMAYGLQDNRAFCKYLCPITVPLKLTSRFAMLKIGGNAEKCSECGACSKICPMDIDVQRYVREGLRVLSTECIFCMTCTTVCPENILEESFKPDLGGKEYLRRR